MSSAFIILDCNKNQGSIVRHFSALIEQMQVNLVHLRRDIIFNGQYRG